jgi:serine/threonine protein kinase
VAPVVDSVDSSPSIDPIIAARYTRIEKLAAEGLDPRYLAQRVDTGALVELQVLSGHRVSDGTLLRALRDQAARAAAVSGQRLPIATVFEYDRTTDGEIVLVMDHPRGPTLRDTLKDTMRREGTLPFERALQFALQIAEALESAHSVGLVHGGLRPENVVLVGPEPAIMLAHFGVDRLLSRSMGPSEKVASPYQAPEQAWGGTTERSDIYALGAILYEMLGGAPPSTGTANRRRIEPQPWKTRRGEISAGLERLITQSLEAVPAQRPSNMSVVCNDLTDAVTLHRRHRAARRVPIVRPKAGARRALFMGSVALGLIGALAVSFAHPRLAFVTSALWRLRSELASRSARPAATPPGPTSSSDPVLDRNVEAGRAIGGGKAPRTSTPAVRPTVEGVHQSDAQQIPRLAGNPASRSPEAPRSARLSERVESVQPPSNVSATEPPRPGPSAADVPEPPRPALPAARRPASPEAREDGKDPGAIIDWLLDRGRGRR